MTTKISGDNISAIANTGVTWNAVTVADGSTQLNASAGNGYFLDTNAGVIEVFLPSSPTRGDTVILADYSGTFATNQIIINTGGVNIDSTVGSEFKVTTNNSIVECVYVDAAKGWLIKLNQAAGTTPSSVLTDGVYNTDTVFISATGGTITTSGDYKIHTFTGDGCFVVSAGNLGCAPGADYLVVAGGGGGGRYSGGGGGAGGYRESSGAGSGCYTVSPLGACVAALPISVTTYPVTVGAGGAASTTQTARGCSGSNSVFSTITSAGGGGGGSAATCLPIPTSFFRWDGIDGGSGGGASGYRSPAQSGTVGSGNTPPVSPPQGNNGGCKSTTTPGEQGGGAGGGATTVGSDGTTTNGGTGGTGATSSINGTPTARAGGGGGGSGHPTAPQGGPGGGGNGGYPGADGVTGTANSGGGGGGGSGACSGAGSGGKGIVIIRYKFQ